MCLAIPSKITKIDNLMAVIDVDGVRREASLLLVEDAQVGDYVIVHVGFALTKLDEASALETLELMRTVGLLEQEFAPSAGLDPTSEPDPGGSP